MASFSRSPRTWLRRVAGAVGLAGGAVLAPWLFLAAPLLAPEAVRAARGGWRANQQRRQNARDQQERATAALTQATEHWEDRLDDVEDSMDVVSGLGNAITNFASTDGEDKEKLLARRESLEEALTAYNDWQTAVATQSGMTPPATVSIDDIVDGRDRVTRQGTQLRRHTERLGPELLQLKDSAQAGLASTQFVGADEEFGSRQHLRQIVAGLAQHEQTNQALLRRLDRGHVPARAAAAGPGATAAPARNIGDVLADAIPPKLGERWAARASQGSQTAAAWTREEAGAGWRAVLDAAAARAAKSAERAQGRAANSADRSVRRDKSGPEQTVAERLETIDADLGRLQTIARPGKGGWEGEGPEADARATQARAALEKRFGADAVAQFETDTERAAALPEQIATAEQALATHQASPEEPDLTGVSEATQSAVKAVHKQQRADAIAAATQARDELTAEQEQLATAVGNSEIAEPHREWRQLSETAGRLHAEFDELNGRHGDLVAERERLVARQEAARGAGAGRAATAEQLRDRAAVSHAAAAERQADGNQFVQDRHLARRPGVSAPTPASAPPGTPGTRTGPAPGPVRAPSR